MSNLDQDEVIAALLTGPRLANERRQAREMVTQWANVVEALREWRAREQGKSPGAGEAGTQAEAAPPSPEDAPA